MFITQIIHPSVPPCPAPVKLNRQVQTPLAQARLCPGRSSRYTALLPLTALPRPRGWRRWKSGSERVAEEHGPIPSSPLDSRGAPARRWALTASASCPIAQRVVSRCAQVVLDLGIAGSVPTALALAGAGSRTFLGLSARAVTALARRQRLFQRDTAKRRGNDNR